MNELSDLAFSMPRRVPLADTVADSIAGAIATGLFAPGDKISEVVLSEQLGVSRVPIREAFKILHSQGIVTGEQNRGYRVAPFDRATVRKVLEVRMALESILLRDAVVRWRANHRMEADLGGPLQQMREAAARNDRGASRESDLQFHRAIANAADNEIARVLWEAIARHVMIIFSRREYRDDDLNSVVRQHEEFRAFIARMVDDNADPETTKRGLEDHLLQVARAKLAEI